MAKELSREELAELLAGIIADNRENPPKNDMAQCNRCRKFHRETITCEKYREWIPREKPVGNCPDYEPKESGAGR